MKPLYIFDLDGTLALCDHRRHFVSMCSACAGTGKVLERVSAMHSGEPCTHCNGVAWSGKPDWNAFFSACINDTPNIPVIDTLHSLVDAGADVYIWSGRSSGVMEQTKKWLANHIDTCDGIPLVMRVEGDFTPDEELKGAWLDQMPAHDRRRLVAVFDDRDKVVAMWRAKGVACFQVASGDF